MPKNSTVCQNRGFTLVELSIVMVIIGLLIGSITVASNMIHKADLRAVVKQVEEYRNVVSTFKEVYLGLPGDIINAKSFWPTTENGNGNEQILYNITAGQENESMRAWQQLALAELIQGSFTGSEASQIGIEDVNMPAAEVGDSVVMKFDYDTWWGNPASNFIMMAKASSTGWPQDAAISPADADYVDHKLDDGMPLTGYVWGGRGYFTDTATWAPASYCADAAGYDVSITTPQCVMAFIID